MLRKFVFSVLLVCFIISCQSKLHARNVLGDLFKIYKTYQEINMTLWLTGDIGAEKRLGKELQMWMKLSSRRDKNASTNAYVKKIFYRLLPYYNTHGLKCDITVLKGNTVNAFAMPGGHIYVYDGLLDFVSSDDELAAVLGHELGHMERRHSLKNFRVSSVAVALLKRAVKNRRDRETWGALVLTLAMMKFSRKQEDEADDIGEFRMAKAGFNPYAQINLWKKFQKRFGNTKGIRTYFASHPPSRERVENARRNISKMHLSGKLATTNTRNILKIKKQNLFKNPSFEELTSGKLVNWQISEGVGSQSNKFAITGKYSLRLDSGSIMTKSRVVSDFIQVTPASKFEFSGWVKTKNGNQNIAIGVELYDKNKRLRNRIWNILDSKALPSKWTNITGIIENGVKNFKINNSIMYIRLVVQNGLVSTGSAWFDDFRLKIKGVSDPVNLVKGDFERLDASGNLEGVINTNKDVTRDLSVAKTGYASARLGSTGANESEIAFEPIAISKFTKADFTRKRQINGSFYFYSKAKINGRLVIEYLDKTGKPLKRKLCKIGFSTRPSKWLATSFNFKLELRDREKKLADRISIRIIANVPDNANLWVDNFILQ